MAIDDIPGHKSASGKFAASTTPGDHISRWLRRRGCPKSPFPLALQVPESRKLQVGCVGCPKTGVFGDTQLPSIASLDAEARLWTSPSGARVTAGKGSENRNDARPSLPKMPCCAIIRVSPALSDTENKCPRASSLTSANKHCSGNSRVSFCGGTEPIR
jgi:hypothetical protein